MLTKDLFKLRSATLPNDNVVKTITKSIFKTKISKKKSKEMFLRNKGIEIEKVEVAMTHEKIIFFRLFGSID